MTDPPLGPLDQLITWLETSLGISREGQGRLLASACIVVGYLIATRVSRRVVTRMVEDARSRYQIGKATGYIAGFIALAALGRVWFQGVTGFATYLGLLSAGVAVSLQEPLVNLAAWLFIVTRRPFSVGDRIQIGPHAGDVVDIRLFQFTLLEIGNWVQGDQSTGRVIHIPNGWAFKNSVANYDRGFRYLWNEIEVVVTFESNWRRAKEVLSRTVSDHAEHLTADAAAQIAEAAERYHLKFSKLTPVVWTSVVDHGVRLTMRYLCKPRDRRRSEVEIWEAVLDELAKLQDVDFAYPTTRFFENPREGKRAARADDGERPSHLGEPPARVDLPASD